MFSEHAGQSPDVFVPPEYTMKEIYDNIPAHCLQPNTWLSLFYILRDYFFVLILVSIATQIPNVPYPYLRSTAWFAYAFVQGLVFTGLWELAHECGHGALSKSKAFNNTCGLIIHSILLVPYYSWKITHSTHHKTTNNLDKDIAFVPTIKEAYQADRETHSKAWDYIEDMPIIAIIHLFFHQIIAWPIYLTINNFALERMAKVPWWKRSHFYVGGDGPNFRPESTREILISDLGIGAMVLVLWGLVRVFGAWNVMLFYGFPWMWTNHWILTITYLQHTDTSIPYYPNKTWTFLRGAASTVDRDFGFIGRVIFHGAIETHVMHHHVSRIPFYHATEATAAVRKVMGSHYKYDFKTPYMWAFWRNHRECVYVEETQKNSQIYFFAKTE
ncbi:hypothetical protein BDZ45DRAFT_587299 [Acephala macrosclerotiorum]|nr:hypothetical protein BDZ45DRAFT_587299 [Acephala macrosclerotiorum]